MYRRSFQIEKYVPCIYKCLLFNFPTSNNIYFGRLIICNVGNAIISINDDDGGARAHADITEAVAT